ncbi:MAG: site-specific integrase [Candidatus Moraniibacteriota bacterium]
MNPLERYLSWKAPQTPRAAVSYGIWLRKLYQFHNRPQGEILSYDDMQAFADWMATKYRPGTRRIAIAAMRDYAAWCRQMGFFDAPFELLKKPRGEAQHFRAIKREDYLRIIAQVDRNASVGMRDLMVLHLFFDSGIRVCEMASLKISQMDTEKCEAVILSAKSRGKKLRKIFWSETTNVYLKRHIEARRASQDGLDWLFVTTHWQAKQKVHERSIQRIIKKYSERAGVKMTCHDIRTTFATDKYYSGLDINSIRWALGHSSISTTQTYIQAADKTIEERIRSVLFSL